MEGNINERQPPISVACKALDVFPRPEGCRILHTQSVMITACLQTLPRKNLSATSAEVLSELGGKDFALQI